MRNAPFSVTIEVMKIAIFGDSITNGYGAADYISGKGSKILKRKLEALHPNLEVVLHGVNGETAKDGLRRANKLVAENADWNFIFFGANDSAKFTEVTAEDFERFLSQIVLKLEPKKTILLTPPYHNDAVHDPDCSNDFIEIYRERTLAVAKQLSLPVIDVYKLMRTSGKPNEFLQSDGLHFSEKGYQFLAEIINQNIV